MDDLSIFTMDCENESSDFFSPVVIQDSTLIDVFDNAIDSFEEADLYGDICMDGTINVGWRCLLLECMWQLYPI